MRLIDANALIKTIKDDHCKGCNKSGCIMCRVCTWMDAMDYIEYAPTIDAQPVKHGHWKHSASGEMYCCYCQYVPQWEDDKFCANCGAKMDGDA